VHRFIKINSFSNLIC